MISGRLFDPILIKGIGRNHNMPIGRTEKM